MIPGVPAPNSTPSSPIPAGRLVKAVLLGVAAGFLSGLFGVGGGLLIVPVLVLLLGMGQRLAHGTSLAAVLPIAMSGVIGFALEDSVDWPVGAALVTGAMAGAVVGTHALQVLPVRVLSYSFSALLIASALRMVLDQSEAAGRSDLDTLAVVALVLLGVASGTLAGMLGVGGGVIMVPAMIILFGIPAAVAKGTSLAVIVPTAMVATQRNLRRHNAELPTAAAVGLAGMASAYAASKLSVGLSERTSNALFAALLAVVAVRMIYSTRRESQAQAMAEAAVETGPATG